MTEETPVSAEAIMLAEAFGAALAGWATEMKLASPVPDPKIAAIFHKGVARMRSNRNVSGTPEQRDAIFAAIQRTAVI